MMMDTVDRIFITLSLGLMVAFTFGNVVVRYVFNGNILWALEATSFLFAWLVIVGASCGVRHNFHIGVDFVVRALPGGPKRLCTYLAAAACITYAGLMLKGAWDYWLPFIGARAFYETLDIPVPFFLTWLADVFNEGEPYEKLPRFIPYFALPLGMALLLLRSLAAARRVIDGRQELLCASHEEKEESASASPEL